MDAKKRLTLVVLGIIIMLPVVTTGCFKKGNEDPFMSMYTRKARMAGTWKFAETESFIRSDIDGQNVILTTTTSNDTKWTQKIEIEASITSSDSTIIYTGTVKQDESYLRFTKHGTFFENFVYEYIIEDYNEDTETTTKRRYYKSSYSTGTWNFLAGVDDYKNKERVALVYEVITSHDLYGITTIRDDDEEATAIESIQYIRDSSWYYANGEHSMVWELLGLKNKEVKMHRPVYNKFSSTNGSIITEQGYYNQRLTR
ncbi:MAG: hypothetical protein LBQ22_04990 [Bacteroidales bacterium]|jgi:hypothetical protein|nr:hypothetical protein [Bacteroidales bacterium]